MLVLAYHDIDPKQCCPWQLCPTILRNQLLLLRSKGYYFISQKNLRLSDIKAPKSVLVHFDDGRLGVYKYAISILEELEIPCSIFPVPAFIENNSTPDCERYSSFIPWSGLREISKLGHTIGAHTFTHPHMHKLVTSERLLEVGESKGRIEQELSQSCDHYVAPYGYFNKEIRIMVQSLGFSSLSTTLLGLNQKKPNPFRLSRWEILSYQSEECFLETLQLLEAQEKEFRILTLSSPLDTSNLDRIKRAAEFDLVSDLS